MMTASRTLTDFAVGLTYDPIPAEVIERAKNGVIDTLCEPSAGIHPGAALAVPGLAVSQGRNKCGGELLAAVVAGYEMSTRTAE